MNDRSISFINLAWRARTAAALATAALLTACGMPGSVSSLSDVREASTEGRVSLVQASDASIPAAAPVQASFPEPFIGLSPFDFDRLGAGDILKVRIWEGGAPTVFTNGTGDLGDLTVDQNGRIYLPYVGAMRVEGLTLAEVRSNVARQLRTMVRNPQVDIKPGERRSMLISVQGNAAKAGTYEIQRGRTRLGELLGEAAPDQKNPEMLAITLRRGSESGTVRLADIYRDPRLDVALRPGDTVVLNEVVENVTVLGAAGVQGQVRILKRDYSVTDVIGAARGLDDESADPRAVFLIRAQPQGAPLVYQFEMRRPETVALAGRFIVRDRDAVMIFSAPFAQTRKVLSAFSQTLGTVRSATTVVP